LLGACVPEANFFPVLEAMFGAQNEYLQKMEQAGQPFQASLQGKQPGEIATAWAEQMGLIDFVKQRGLPEAQARACLTDAAKIDALVKVTDEGAKSGKVTGTPTFLLNGERVEAATWEQLEPALKAAGA
jgi:protein-disulfide isomerase